MLTLLLTAALLLPAPQSRAARESKLNSAKAADAEQTIRTRQQAHYDAYGQYCQVTQSRAVVGDETTLPRPHDQKGVAPANQGGLAGEDCLGDVMDDQSLSTFECFRYTFGRGQHDKGSTCTFSLDGGTEVTLTRFRICHPQSDTALCASRVPDEIKPAQTVSK